MAEIPSDPPASERRAPARHHEHLAVPPVQAHAPKPQPPLEGVVERPGRVERVGRARRELDGVEAMDVIEAGGERPHNGTDPPGRV